MRINFLKLIFITFVLTVSSCNTNYPRQNILTDSTKMPVTTSYPAQGTRVSKLSVRQGYPSPISPQSTNSNEMGLPIKNVVPTLNKDKVIILGQMLTPNKNGIPYIGDIFLGSLIPADQGDFPPMIKFSEKDSPKGVVDTQGNFYFSNVEPGEYVLIVYSLGGTYIVLDDKGETLYVAGEAGKFLDLGIIVIP